MLQRANRTSDHRFCQSYDPCSSPNTDRSRPLHTIRSFFFGRFGAGSSPNENGPRPMHSILSLCVQRAGRTLDNRYCHCYVVGDQLALMSNPSNTASSTVTFSGNGTFTPEPPASCQPVVCSQLPVVPNKLPLPTSVATCPFVFGKRGVTPDGLYDSSSDM